MEHAKFFQHRGQRRVKFFKIFERKYFAGDLPEYGGDTVLLIKKIGAESRSIWYFVAEIHVARFLKDFDLVLRGDFVEHLFQLVIIEGSVVNTLELAVDPQHRVVIRAEVQVRG